MKKGLLSLFIIITFFLYRGYCQSVSHFSEMIYGDQNKWKQISHLISKGDTILILSSGVVNFGIFAGSAFSNGYTYPKYAIFNLKEFTLERHGALIFRLNGETQSVEPMSDVIDQNRTQIDGILTGLSISNQAIGCFLIAVDDGYLEVLINDADADNNSGQFKVEIFKKEGCKIPYDFFNLPDCPCNLSKLRSNLKTTCPAGKWESFSVNDDYHIGANFEYRWIPNESRKPGQQCTYDKKGNLITGGFAAGTPDKVSPSGLSISTLEHYNNDVRPFGQFPCSDYMKEWKPNQGDGCSGIINTINGGLITAFGNKITCVDLIALLKIAIQNPAICKHILEINMDGANLNKAKLKIEFESLLDKFKNPLYLSQSEVILRIYSAYFP